MKTGIFGLLRVLDKISEKDLVTVDRTKCMRYRNKRSRCTICQDTCPLGAITLNENNDDIIAIDGYVCTGCGICVNTCPNPVFSLMDLDIESIIKSVGDNKQITISCHRNACNIQVPCLGYINESILLTLASMDRQIELNISACKSCDYSTAIGLIQNHVETANALLQCIGKDEMITVVEDEGLNDTLSETFLRKLVSQFSHDSSNQENKNQRQILFIEALKNMGSVPQKSIDADKVPFGSINIQQSCNGCSMCVAICPVDALSTIDNKTFTLKFKPDLCTGCGLCSQICNQNCIHFETLICLHDLVQGEWKNLIEIEKVKCEECGEFFVKESGSPLCISCIKNKEIEESFFG